jgi:hypothetical protein
MRANGVKRTDDMYNPFPLLNEQLKEKSQKASAISCASIMQEEWKPD